MSSGPPAWIQYLIQLEAVTGCDRIERSDAAGEGSREDLAQLLAMLQKKSIRPVVAERVPLREAARAHQLLEQASVSGKIVLMRQE